MFIHVRLGGITPNFRIIVFKLPGSLYPRHVSMFRVTLVTHDSSLSDYVKSLSRHKQHERERDREREKKREKWRGDRGIEKEREIEK